MSVAPTERRGYSMFMDSIADQLSQPVRIGTVALANRVILAPLAGVSDIPFRRICQELGAGLSFVEMLNCNAVLNCQPRTIKAISRHPTEPVLGVQVTGPRPEEIAKAIQKLDCEGFDLVDINMGCPVRKIVGRGSGSGILRDLERVAATVEQAIAATAKPVSVKVRLGLTRENVNVEQTARIVAQHGAAMYTVHGRTRSERYNTPVDYDGIRLGLETARAVAGPQLVTVGNGDILRRDSAYDMVRQTGCDAVMVSRGALGNPWLFRQILDPNDPEPTVSEWLDVVLRHLDYHADYYGPDPYAVVLTRKHLLWYASGFPDTRRFREHLSRVATMEEARRMLKGFAAALPPALRRYEGLPSDEVAPPRTSSFDPKYDMSRMYDRGAGEEG